jgi:hypothetical protein
MIIAMGSDIVAAEPFFSNLIVFYPFRIEFPLTWIKDFIFFPLKRAVCRLQGNLMSSTVDPP